MTTQPSFSAKRMLPTTQGTFSYHDLSALKEQFPQIDKLPVSIRILLESLLRNYDGFAITTQDIHNLASWDAKDGSDKELPFKPARVVLQDFTGVPLLVDIAAMRAAVQKLGKDPKSINPSVPVDLVIDHSVQVDYYGTPDALVRNAHVEFARNRERYEFLRWGQQAVHNFRVVPPSTGIVHQVNLEYLAQGVLVAEDGTVYPDTMVGTDSHTTMINGLGAVGWGVGGIEAEAVMLGQPLFLTMPRVVGFKLTGAMQPGVTATDLTLTITQMLRKKGVVDQFVEFYGAGLSSLSVEDRATIANMAPEYGATIGFFPVDALTINYLHRTGRAPERVNLCEQYYKAQGLFRDDNTPDPVFSDVVQLDLSKVEPSVAGPKRPQDRVAVGQLKDAFQTSLRAPLKEQGFALKKEQLQATADELQHGSVVIAAITSCTNTSNPSVMLAAGILAKKAVEAGLSVPSYVKTSLAPGSKVVTDYLQQANLLPYLEKLGFYLVGFGCTTCIGNSGPLPEKVEKAIEEGDLVAAAVLSGNRNFEGRIHPAIRANYLASPPLVVAYALAGTVDKNLQTEPLGYDKKSNPIYLRDIWPSPQEILQTIQAVITPEAFARVYAEVFHGNEEWNAISGSKTDLYEFQPDSTYIQEPPFFKELSLQPKPIEPIQGAHVLCLLGDSITTDHISPAGSIAKDSPAGQYLQAQGVPPGNFNSYGARRGNDRVMVRGTFANVRLKNAMVPGTEGGLTLHVPSGRRMSIFEASETYRVDNVPLLVIAGKEYGTGSSRDWAAKGTLLLGVRAVIAESFERIHRSNLVGMGVLPLVFQNGENAEKLGLIGFEEYFVDVPSELSPRQPISVRVKRTDGTFFQFVTQSRLDTPIDIKYYQNGGILHTVLRDLLNR